MKNVDLNKTWIGILFGLIAPSLAMLGYYYINFGYLGMNGFINYLKLGDTYTPLISLCVLSNLAVFYPFIWKEKWNGAKGVLAATFIWTAIVMYLKFFT
ncbi:MAG: hypothetical protein ABI315_07845 [Bacteroidia bacterium]